MDLWRSFIAGPSLGSVPGALVCLRLTHGLILTRLNATRKYDEESGDVAFCNKVSNTFDNFTDANRPIKNGDELVAIGIGVRGSSRKRDGVGARGYKN